MHCIQDQDDDLGISISEASIYLLYGHVLDGGINFELLDYISALLTVEVNMVSQMPSDIETQKNKEKCQALLKLSPKIRYVGIVNEFGRTLAGQLRKGVTPFFKVQEARNEFFVEATRNLLRRSFVCSIGETEFTLTVNEKVIILILPAIIGSRLYYFTFDKDTSLQEVIEVKDTTKKLMVDKGI
jgi:hypothetical protein